MYSWTVRKSSTAWKWWSMIKPTRFSGDNEEHMANKKNIYIVTRINSLFQKYQSLKIWKWESFSFVSALTSCSTVPPAPLLASPKICCNVYCLGFLMTTIITITKGENKRPFCLEFQANNPMKNAIKNSCQCSRLWPFSLPSQVKKRNILVP